MTAAREAIARRSEAGASDLELLMEMAAAYALNPGHDRWSRLASVRGFLDAWRQGAASAGSGGLPTS